MNKRVMELLKDYVYCIHCVAGTTPCHCDTAREEALQAIEDEVRRCLGIELPIIKTSSKETTTMNKYYADGYNERAKDFWERWGK